MTEKEWLTARSVEPMREWWQTRRNRPLRKERLFACACCRRHWDHLPDERSRAAIEAAEKFADGLIDKKALAAARLKATRAARDVAKPGEFGIVWRLEDAVQALMNLSRGDVFRASTARVLEVVPRFKFGSGKKEAAEQAQLLRDVLGNPFRPVTFSPEWRTGTAVSLARTTYEAREFSAMPILADALQDAGCANDDILNHCRDANQVHVRGCWVVDLVLGKE